jgi:nucleotide-binding universal stress UspA family protein
MSIKNMMVHLDQGERTVARLQLAVSLARRHQARLVGVFGQLAEAHQVGVVASWPSPSYIEAAQAAKAKFEQAAVGLAQAEWHDINRGSDHELFRHITDLARFMDLVVMGQHDYRLKADVPAELVEEVVLNSGRPVLVVPFVGRYADVGKRPLIAWNDAREAAHAVNDSLPLIEGCDEATVISFSARRDDATASCAEVARHLACHGIKAKTEVMVVDSVGIMDMLLNRVSDLAADLLIMGAHGAIGFPFVSRGAGTRFILQHMTVPVLMSN